MKVFDPKFDVLRDEQNCEVFRQVLHGRRVRLKDLRARLKDMDPERLGNALRSLHEADLIDERGAAIEDFSRFYITAEGLRTGRELDL